ncbi:hypothetical protein D3C81_837490 [compost metagenome]
MLHLFHTTSQNVLRSPAPTESVRFLMDNEIERLKSIREAIAEFEQRRRMAAEEMRLNRLVEVQERRWLIQKQPRNEWGIYELCKCIYELAEIDRVDFNGAGVPQKLELIQMIVPFADPQALCGGVLEYHDSRRTQGWGMAYLQEPEIQNHYNGRV